MAVRKKSRKPSSPDPDRWRFTAREVPLEYEVVEGAWALVDRDTGRVGFARSDCYRHESVGSMLPGDNCWHAPVPGRQAVSVPAPEFWRPQVGGPPLDLVELLPDIPRYMEH